MKQCWKMNILALSQLSASGNFPGIADVIGITRLLQEICLS